MNASAQTPIQLHPQNPHYFLFREKPTVLITSAEHYGAVINPEFDYIPYLDELAEKGLNYTRIFSGTYSEAAGLGDFNIPFNTLGPKPGTILMPYKRTDKPGFFRGGNKVDLDQWDEAYFTRLKAFLTEAGNRGIVVELTLFSSHYSEDGWLSSPFNLFNPINSVDSVSKAKSQTLLNGNVSAYQEKLVRKIVRELNGFDNLFYEIQNEPWAEEGVNVRKDVKHTDPIHPGSESWHQNVELANPASLEWQKKMASAIKDEEKSLPKKHLIAQNISNFSHKIADADPQVSIFHFHYAFPEAAFENQALNRVIGFDESGFNGTTDSVYRRQAWRFMLAGGGLFNNLDYSFTTEHENGDFVNSKAPGGGSKALRSQLNVLKNFLEATNFIAMKPVFDQFYHLPTGTRAYVLESTDNEHFAAYFEGKATAYGDVVLKPGTYQEEWIDVITGKILKQIQRLHPGGSHNLRGPEGQGEVALRLNKVK